MALVITHVLLSRLTSSSGVGAIALIGSISAVMPLRALLDLASQRTRDDCPLLLTCPRYRIVEIFEACISATVLCAVNLMVRAVGEAWVGSMASSASKTDALASLIFLVFALCRISKVSRTIESGALCVFGAVGVVVEYV
jgi:hypothetical protein